MPYIKQEDRARLNTLTNLISDTQILTAGELNYLITYLTHTYINQGKLSYQVLNDAVGALEGAKLELYRRLVSPYEDRKIAENGDV
jgi:hypothetical protein